MFGITRRLYRNEKQQTALAKPDAAKTFALEIRKSSIRRIATSIGAIVLKPNVEAYLIIASINGIIRYVQHMHIQK